MVILPVLSILTPLENWPYYSFLVPANAPVSGHTAVLSTLHPLRWDGFLVYLSNRYLNPKHHSTLFLQRTSTWNFFFLLRWTRIGYYSYQELLKSYLSLYILWTNVPKPNCTSKFLGIWNEAQNSLFLKLPITPETYN